MSTIGPMAERSHDNSRDNRMKKLAASGVLILAIAALILTGLRRPSLKVTDTDPDEGGQGARSPDKKEASVRGHRVEPRSAGSSLDSQKTIMTYAPGTHGATSNATVALLDRYDLPKDPATVAICINAVREVNIQRIQLDRYLGEVEEQMDDVRYDSTLSDEERARRTRLIDSDRFTYRALFTNVFKQAREIGVTAVTKRLGSPPHGFIEELYSNIPPPMETIQTVR